MPDDHRPGRRRAGQVAPGDRARRAGRRSGASAVGPMPPVRRGHHLLAGRRAGQGGRRDRRDGRAGRRALQAARARRGRGGRRRGRRTRFGRDRARRGRRGRRRHPGDLLGGAPPARDPRGGCAARRAVRGHPLGRADLPRPAAVRHEVQRGASAAPRLHRPPRPPRDPPGLEHPGRDDRPRAAQPGPERRPDREPARARSGSPPTSRRGSPTRPRATRCSSRRCSAS